MVSIQDIRDLVAEYVAGNIVASDLANRFAHVLRSAVKSPDESVRQMAVSVHAQISHFFHGVISEDELRATLEPFGKIAIQGFGTVLSYNIIQTVQPEPVLSNPDHRSVVFPRLELIPTP